MKTFRNPRTTAPTRRSRYSRGSRALAISSASVAGVAALTFAAHASAEPAQSSAPQRVAAVTTIATATPDTPVRVEHEIGAVLEGRAEPGTPVMVFLYDNQLHGSSLQVVLGDPEGDNIGAVEQTEAFIQDGVLDVTVDVNGTDVRLHGTVRPSGRPTKLVDPQQDNGERIVTKGTNTPLTADVTVTVDGASAPMTFDTAFAFDLESRKVTLYGR